jgi:hypothetical protein
LIDQQSCGFVCFSRYDYCAINNHFDFTLLGTSPSVLQDEDEAINSLLILKELQQTFQF